MDLYKGYSGTYYGVNRQNTFIQVWDEAEKFLSDYKASGIPVVITDDNCTTLFYLLFASYGNSTIRSSDTERFKYSVFSLIFRYGPNWEKELEVQNILRNMTEEELISGSRAIYNTALNPETEPTTEELDYISQQNTTKYTKSKLEAYNNLLMLLKKDVTTAFINKFKPLFKVVVQKELPLIYFSEVEDD